MKNLKDILVESKCKKSEITLCFDDLDNDVYNTLSELMFGYHEEGKELSKEDLEKAFKNFMDKFFAE